MPDRGLLSDRAKALQPSLTLAIAAKAKQLRADGADVCSLSAGEPDFDTPEFIRAAAIKALDGGQTRYGPAAGEPALREAIAAKLSQENHVASRPAQVLVTDSGKQALYNLFQVLQYLVNQEMVELLLVVKRKKHPILGFGFYLVQFSL